MILSQIPTELVGDPDEITLDNSESFETMIQKLVVSSDEVREYVWHTGDKMCAAVEEANRRLEDAPVH